MILTGSPSAPGSPFWPWPGSPGSPGGPGSPDGPRGPGGPGNRSIDKSVNLLSDRIDNVKGRVASPQRLLFSWLIWWPMGWPLVRRSIPYDILGVDTDTDLARSRWALTLMPRICSGLIDCVMGIYMN